MERFEGRCRLDWWANSVTLLASVEIELTVAVTTAGWAADGHLIDSGDDDGFISLCEMDPVFLLWIDDESTIAVTVHPAEDGRRFSLTGYTGSAHPTVSYRAGL